MQGSNLRAIFVIFSLLWPLGTILLVFWAYGPKALLRIISLLKALGLSLDRVQGLEGP